MALDIFALIVMGILIAVVIAAVVKLGPLPGNIAKKRGHPQADAINVLGWIGGYNHGCLVAYCTGMGVHPLRRTAIYLPQ